ncbi:myopalladin-like [Scleropages formosus]|uniref:myopalladin-like n=1 Tax=Scleropages formosus TaxID=113540 RepID=UPI0010FACC52|nr:myopalladin-like [Scleropages formosus]
MKLFPRNVPPSLSPSDAAAIPARKTKATEAAENIRTPPAAEELMIPPSFVVGLNDTSALEGETVTLECQISGRPTPTIVWFREERKIENSSDFRLSFEKGRARLEIGEAFAEDSGRFSCTATGEAGTASTSCYLTVHGNFEKNVKNNETTMKTEATAETQDREVLPPVVISDCNKQQAVVIKNFAPEKVWSSPKTVLSSSLEPVSVGLLGPLALEEGPVVAPVWTRVGRKLTYSVEYRDFSLEKLGTLLAQSKAPQGSGPRVTVAANEARNSTDSSGLMVQSKTAAPHVHTCHRHRGAN